MGRGERIVVRAKGTTMTPADYDRQQFHIPYFLIPNGLVELFRRIAR